jgi:hypothetical protein
VTHCKNKIKFRFGMHPQLRNEGPLLPVEKALPWGLSKWQQREGSILGTPPSKGIIPHKNLTQKERKKKILSF